MPVHVLVEQITERPRTTGVAGLRAECAQPHEIPCLDLDPVLIQPVDRPLARNTFSIFGSAIRSGLLVQDRRQPLARGGLDISAGCLWITRHDDIQSKRLESCADGLLFHL